MLYLFVVNILLYLCLCCLIFFPFRESRQRGGNSEARMSARESEEFDGWDGETPVEEDDEEAEVRDDEDEEVEDEESGEDEVVGGGGSSSGSSGGNIAWMAKKCLDLISSVESMSLEEEDVDGSAGREMTTGGKKKSTSMFEELLECLKGKRRSDFYSWEDVLSGRRDSVRVLLDRGFSVSGTDREGDSLLHYACRQGDAAAVVELLDRGSRMTLNKKSESPLHVCVTSGHGEIATILLDRGAHVNGSDRHGYTPLHIAAKSSDLALVELLLRHRADTRAKTHSGLEPVHLAVRNPGILTLFVQERVDVNVRSKDGSSPLHFAARCNCAESMDILLKNKALVNIRDVDGSTPLAVQCKNFSFFSEDNLKCFDCVKILLGRGACANTRDYCGQTPLHFATENELVDIMELLLEFGADPNVISEAGDSPLHTAVRNQSLEVVYTLLEWGADINLAGELDETPLDIAAQSLLMFNVWNYSSEVLVKHIAKFITAGIYLPLTDSLSTLYKKVSAEFLRKCSDEVFKLSGKTIVLSTSFLDVLTARPDRLTRYLRNNRVEEMFRRADYLNDFPLYSSLLSLRFRIGFETNYLIDKSFKLFKTADLNLPRLPFDCFEKICDYLSLSDLKNLAHACQTADSRTGTCFICKGQLSIPKHNVSLPAGSKRFHLIKILNY